ELGLAFSSLSAVNEDVVARTTGVGALPLSQACARVSQAASTAKAAARNVVKAAEAAEAAADTAMAAVSAAQAAQAAATAESAAANTAVAAAEAAKPVARASVKLEIDSTVMRDRIISSGDNGVINDSGLMPSADFEAGVGDITVAVKTCESDMLEEEEAEHCTPQGTEVTGDEHESSYVDDWVPEVESTDQERQEESKALSEMDDGEEEREEDEH
ncbi:unnamed protein product, partial [Ectocarpus fasciculatus]